MRRAVPAFLALCLPSCIIVAHEDAPEWIVDVDDGPPCAQIEGSRILEHIRVLASDEFEGRGPATPGEDKTVDYLVGQLKAFGLEPGNPDGTYTQAVPLVGMRARTSGSFRVDTGGAEIPLRFGVDAVGLTRRFVPEVRVDSSPVVFVGYGVVAPEYGWDDAKGLDLKGKTIVMLVNDPPVPDPADPTKLDAAMFQGRAMTYYGRWTYKYEFAARVGAAAAILVHQTGPAGYPWSVVQDSWGSENFEIEASEGNAGRAAVEGWITLEKAKELFGACGQDFESLRKAAATKEFRPVPLGATASFQVQNEFRRVASRNVAAKLTGSDPERKSELVVYSAHWDHLGRHDQAGDAIFNGAVDNASGSAGLLEIARSFRLQNEAPPRSILFLWVTAEEKGLLGSRWYAAHPLYPLEKTLANVNMDSLNLWGRTSDVVCVGYGQSTLDDVLVRLAGDQGRTVVPDAEPEKGFYYRSDHFEFAKVGVPALYADGGLSLIGRPPGYGLAKSAEYTANDYHKPSDEVRPDWDLSGAALDMQLLFRVGREVARDDAWPRWKESSEFRAVREASLGPAR